MILTLDPPVVRMVLVEFDDSGVPAVDHVGSLDRKDEFSQEHLRGFVATMFGPRLSEALQLHLGWVASEPLEMRLDLHHFVDAQRKPHPIADLSELVPR